MEVDGDSEIPDKWEDVYLERDGNCLFLGETVKSEHVMSDNAEDCVVVSGYSHGMYLQRPLTKLEDRALKNTSGQQFEDPITYLNRLIWPGGVAVCGLEKGFWEESVENWGKDECPYQPFEQVSCTATIQTQIDNICAELDLFHYDDWVLEEGIWKPKSYLATIDHLNTSCNLPPTLVLTCSDRMIDFVNPHGRTFRKQDDQSQYYNRIYVEGILTASDGSETR
jgi:hypothetical protein